MEAIFVALELHTTDVVTSSVPPSVYVPTALNCSVVPSATEAFAGVTASETNAAAATVRVVEPVTLPDVALMVVVPVPTLAAKPVWPIVATLIADELQFTELVRFCVLPLR